MQKKIIALAIAAAASSAAFAQSNVTLYGVVDAGVANVQASGHPNTKAVISGGLAGSRIGFKGAEDLGNGLKAIFTLEYGLAVDQNQGIGGDQSANKARQQFVGVTSDKLGTAVVGYLQTAAFDFQCATNPLAGGALDGYGLVGASSLFSCGKAGRASNAIAYVSPSIYGVTVALNHARLTEDAYTAPAGANQTGNDATANILGLSYANGPLSVGAAYAKQFYDNTTVTNDDVVEYGVRASYDFQVAKLFASWQRVDNKAYEGRNSKWQVSASVPVTANGAVHAMYAQNKINEATATLAANVADDTTKAYTLAYTQGLSKRTSVYAGYTLLKNGDNAGLGAFSFYDLTGTTKTSLTPATGGNASVMALGVNHKF